VRAKAPAAYALSVNPVSSSACGLRDLLCRSAVVPLSPIMLALVAERGLAARLGLAVGPSRGYFADRLHPAIPAEAGFHQPLAALGKRLADRGALLFDGSHWFSPIWPSGAIFIQQRSQLVNRARSGDWQNLSSCRLPCSYAQRIPDGGRIGCGIALDRQRCLELIEQGDIVSPQFDVDDFLIHAQSIAQQC
jgi:hypothetical protein